VVIIEAIKFDGDKPYDVSIMSWLRCLFFVGLVCAGQASGWAFEARVVGVTDGDTVTVLDASKTQHKIRLAGIDAPEKSMPFGNRAKEHLSSLVFGKDVVIDGQKLDRYQRRVAKVLLANRDTGLAMIESGHAWHYAKYEREQDANDRLLYREAQAAARSARRGLWVDPEPVAPWDWRHAKQP
jgi:endonuclease YncB( thermonuclease family)